MPYDLRPYQRAATDAIWSSLREGMPAPLVCLPTGAGKTAVVAEIACVAARSWGARVLVLCHVKELIDQLSGGIALHWDAPLPPVGIFSAGLGQRRIDQITVAGIQSVYSRATDLGKVNLVIIDEAHTIPPAGEGMYRTLLDQLRVINPSMRIVGLTATPYRLTSGVIMGEGQTFTAMVYDAGVRPLIDGGYLSPLRGKNGGDPDLAGVHRRGGEFIAAELEAAMADEEKVRHAVAELLKHGAERKAWLVFCCGVRHAGMVAEALTEAGIESAVITGETPTSVRDAIVARYKRRELRCLVNVNVLTTGFDAPHVDLVALLRPTESEGLYYQMVGRGLRKAEGKADCLILDLAGNIGRHGPVDLLNDRLLLAAQNAGEKQAGTPPMKICPQCAEQILAAVRMCPCCGYEWPVDEARHGTVASDLSPVSDPTPPEPEWYTYQDIEYRPHTKKGGTDADPRTLAVTYWGPVQRIATEWVCVEHAGFAGRRAWEWLGERLRPGWTLGYRGDRLSLVEESTEVWYVGSEGIASAAQRALRRPSEIGLVPDGKYERVTAYRWGREPGADEEEGPFVGAAQSQRIDDEPPF
jgi:DNA repair protein RadD